MNFKYYFNEKSGASQVTLVVKKPSVNEGDIKDLESLNQEDQEDPLEEGMEIHSSILAWRIPWKKEPGRLQSMGLHTV